MAKRGARGALAATRRLAAAAVAGGVLQRRRQRAPRVRCGVVGGGIERKRGCERRCGARERRTGRVAGRGRAQTGVGGRPRSPGPGLGAGGLLARRRAAPQQRAGGAAASSGRAAPEAAAAARAVVAAGAPAPAAVLARPAPTRLRSGRRIMRRVSAFEGGGHRSVSHSQKLGKRACCSPLPRGAASSSSAGSGRSSASRPRSSRAAAYSARSCDTLSACSAADKRPPARASDATCAQHKHAHAKQQSAGVTQRGARAAEKRAHGASSAQANDA